MASKIMPVTAEAPSNRQRLFVRYFTAILIDLVVLNLFAEYSSKVSIDSFTTSLLAAVLLQILLKLTLAIEHRVAAYFETKPGGFIEVPTFLFCVAFAVRIEICDPRSTNDGVRRGGSF